MIPLLLGCMALASCGGDDNAFDATGTFETTEVTVSAKVSGELMTFDLQEGQSVDENAEVGRIDMRQTELRRQQLTTQKSQFGASRQQTAATKSSTDSRRLNEDTQMAVIRQQIANARREYQRYSELARDGAVAQKQVDEIGYQISVLERQVAATADQVSSNNASLSGQSEGFDAQMEGLDAQMEGIDAQIAQIDDQLANAIVRSPLGGTILEKYVERGEFVTVGKPLFKVGDTKNMVMRAYVTSQQLAGVKVGQKVRVRCTYGGDHKQEYEGTVTWVSDRSEFTPKTIVTDDERADLVYAVKIAVKNDGNIKIGMYGEVKF